MAKIHVAALFAAAVFGLAPVCLRPARARTSAPTAPELRLQDRKFLNYAAEDNQAEIKLCLLAEKTAQAPAVQAFARLMVDDHVEIESRLATLLDALRVGVSDGIGQEGEQTEAKLSPLRGTPFDRAFLTAQISDHANDIKRFSEEEASTPDKEIRQYAAETIPILEQHLALARSVESALSEQRAQATMPARK